MSTQSLQPRDWSVFDHNALVEAFAIWIAAAFEFLLAIVIIPIQAITPAVQVLKNYIQWTSIYIGFLWIAPSLILLLIEICRLIQTFRKR